MRRIGRLVNFRSHRFRRFVYFISPRLSDPEDTSEFNLITLSPNTWKNPSQNVKQATEEKKWFNWNSETYLAFLWTVCIGAAPTGYGFAKAARMSLNDTCWRVEGFFPFTTSVNFFVNNVKLLLLAVMGLTRFGKIFFLELKRVGTEEMTKHAHFQAYNLKRVFFFSGSLIWSQMNTFTL